MSNIALLPIIPAFVSPYLALDYAQVQQRLIAESEHQQDNDTFVLQWCSQTKGWPMTLSALEGSPGYISYGEYNLLMGIKDVPQVLTLKHYLVPDGVSVRIKSINLRPLLGTVDTCSSTRFVGSVGFVMA